MKTYTILLFLLSFYLCYCKLIDPKSLPLSTKGSIIVDSIGNQIRFACVNWYGAHMTRYVVNGLDMQQIDKISQKIVELGFNCVRLPFSLEQLYKNPLVSPEALKANPQFIGMNSMQIFDETVNSLTQAGLMVILNNHISDAGWCCSQDDGNGAWYNKNYSEQMWIDALVQLTTRYKKNLLVVGNDLRNELRPDSINSFVPQWGSGVLNQDWKIAAKTASDEILKVNPDHLIIVEGLDYANIMLPIKLSPLKLSVPNKLIYSYHIYSWQSMVDYSSYELFKSSMDQKLTFMLQENQEFTAPVWMGEFGQNNSDNYWKFLIQYMQERKSIGWSLWAFNGYKNQPGDDESFGLMEQDMITIRYPWMIQDLKSIMN